MLIVALWRTIFSRFDTEPYDYQALIDSHIDTLLRGLQADAPRVTAEEASA